MVPTEEPSREEPRAGQHGDSRPGAWQPARWRRLLAQPRSLLALAFCALVLRLVQLSSPEGRHLLIDDAFISFRYAQNLARGQGLVFNAGERVEGYTNFLWTVLLALCDRLNADLPQASVAFALLATMATIILMIWAGRHLLASQSPSEIVIATAVVGFAVLGCQSRYVLSGMETSLFVFLVTLAMACVLARAHPLGIGALFAVTAMTRPEGVLYLAVAAAFELLPDGPEAVGARLRRVALLLLGFAAFFAPYLAWRVAYYGSWLPNTYYVKVGGGPGVLLAERGWRHLVYAVRQSSLELPAVMALLALVLWPRDRFLRLTALVATATAIYMVLVGGDFQFFFGPRFLMPALPMLFLAASVAAVNGLPLGLPGRRGVWSAIGALALVGNSAVFSWPGRDDSLATISAINRGWAELGRWLEERTSPDAVIAVGAIGQIPYYSERYTIDMLGLTDPHIARRPIALGRGMVGHEKYDSGYVLDRRPDYMIFVLLDAQGDPAVPDWHDIEGDFRLFYELVALVKATDVPGPWVLETPLWRPERLERGYRTGVFRRISERPSGDSPGRSPVAAAIP
jgi:arabinofuranosyltransferase